MAGMAWGENAVVVKDDGNRVDYHRRCPYCGKVADRQTGNVIVGQGSIVSAGAGRCMYCGKDFSCRFGRR